MNKNSYILFLVSAFVGISNGLYTFVYPFFLDQLGISFSNMGIIFSAASLGMAILAVIVGWLSDLWGRKELYSFSISLAFITTSLTPILHNIWELFVIKIFRDIADSVRMSIHPTLLYDYTRKDFARLLARTKGLTSVMAALGTMISGYLMLSFGFRGVFFISGIFFLLSTLLITLFFIEKPRDTSHKVSLDFRKALSWDIPQKLKYISGSNFIFTLGNSMSHRFIMPLFFGIKFGLSPATVAIIMSLHRFSSGLPMILGASFIFQREELIKKHLKKIAMISLLYQGLMIAITGFSPYLWLAIIGWLSHDIFGPPLRHPAQGTLIQRFSREETRGRDTNIVNSFGKLGGIFSPIITGFLASMNISFPVIASGLVVTLAPLFYLLIKDEETIFSS
ncbi:MAG: MFS transporter [Promethearchaeota archaeon]